MSHNISGGDTWAGKIEQYVYVDGGYLNDQSFEGRTKHTKNFFDEIKRLPGFHVHLGQVRGEGKRMRQKGVDVQLATHMLTHSFRRITKHVTLLAGDGDFLPLVRALVEEGTYLTLWSQERTTSTDLMDAADVHRSLDLFELYEKASDIFRDRFPGFGRFAAPDLSREPDDELIQQGMLGTSIVQAYDNGTRALHVIEVGPVNKPHLRFPKYAMIGQYLKDSGRKVVWA